MAFIYSEKYGQPTKLEDLSKYLTKAILDRFIVKGFKNDEKVGKGT